MAECYHRSLAGKVTWVEMTRGEVEAAVKRAPWEWSTSSRLFAPWPPSRVRGVPVIPPSLADEAKPIASSLWKRA
jgi:hypothetical protein